MYFSAVRLSGADMRWDTFNLADKLLENVMLENKVKKKENDEAQQRKA